VLAAPYALRGVYRNVLPLTSAAKIRIGVICLSPSIFPVCLLALLSETFHVDWVFLHAKSRWTSWLRAQFPSLCIANALPLRLNVEWIFCEGRPPGSSCPVWTCPNLRFLLATNTPSRAAPRSSAWSMHKYVIPHARVGGATSCLSHIFLFHRDPVLAPISIDGMPRRSVSSVVDTTVHGTPFDPHISPAAHANSINALLNWAQPRARYCIPSVFSPTRFVSRRLTPHELLAAADFPLSFIKRLPDAMAGVIHTYVLCPLKVHQAVLTSLLQLRDSGSTHGMSSAALPSRPRQQKVLGPIPATGGGDSSKVVQNGFEVDSSRVIYYNSKATKSDDAGVPVLIWNERIKGGKLTSLEMEALNGLRLLGLRWWKREVTRDYWKWLRTLTIKDTLLSSKTSCTYLLYNSFTRSYKWNSTGLKGYKKWYQRTFQSQAVNMNAARECIYRAANSSWWEWDAGSRPLFWRWAKDYVATIRDGVPPTFQSTPLRWVRPQSCDSKTKPRVLNKLNKVWKERQYMEKGTVKGLTRFFAVPKGPEDIRMVYDASVSGLNDALWAPWFVMPTIRSHLRAVDVNTFMGDVDIGEMFLNFVLHDELKPHCGVDLTTYYPGETTKEKTLWVRWNRCCMGLKSSPYNCVQGILHAAESIFGDPSDLDNPFQWDHVELNLPGSASYDPSKPWVCKIRLDGSIACDLFIYVDDLRPTGGTEEDCWKATRRTGSRCSYLGIQDASRKRRSPSQTPGAWAGSIIRTDGKAVYVSVSAEKWDKTKKQIAWLKECLVKEERIPFKELERIRGFLVYTSRTYTSMVPFLKGIHLTLDGWRRGRDSEGWKRMRMEDDGEVDFAELYYGDALNLPPDVVEAVPRLKSDVAALSIICESTLPPQKIIRCTSSFTVAYGFGDASGKGFGSGVQVDTGFHYRFGEWSTEESERSSNYRELHNLVIGLEEYALQGLLAQKEIFLFTDNSTAEGAYFRGTSSNATLFNLILRLRKLEQDCQLILHVIHVAGTRMIECGVDGLSRGDTKEGIMGGTNILHFIPLSLTSVERSPTLLTWINTWFGKPLELLETDDWFAKGHTELGNWMWAPAPAAAEVAVEQLCLSRHKRPASTHVMVVPRLMTAYWRKMLRKVADVQFVIPVGSPSWPLTMHEPLIISVCFPHLRTYPWRYKGSTLMGALEGQLRSVWKTTPERLGLVLRQFFSKAWSLGSLPEGILRKVLHPPPTGSIPNCTPHQRGWRGSRKRRRGASVQGRKKRG